MPEKQETSALQNIINATKNNKKGVDKNQKFRQTLLQTKGVRKFQNIRAQNRGK